MTTKDTIIREDGFGFAPRNVFLTSEGNPYNIVRRYTMTNSTGASVRLITWGAGIQSIIVPNNKGVLGDVALGFDDLDGYLHNRHIGRITNRVAIATRKKNNNTSSKDNEKIIYLDQRQDDFDSVNWESFVLDKQVIMSHVRRREGCGGDTFVQAEYSWTNENELNVKIWATSTSTIAVNLTNHCPLNLAGHGTTDKELKNHVVTVNADEWTLESGKNNLSNVDRRKFDSTIFDLRSRTILKNRLNVIPGGGYDHNFFVNTPSQLCYRFHGRVLHRGSGRFLEIYSDQPSLHFDTGNNWPDPGKKFPPNLEDFVVEGCDEVEDRLIEMEVEDDDHLVEEIRGKDGISYKRHCCFVMSPQSIPARVLCPGKIFEHNFTYKFGVRTKNE